MMNVKARAGKLPAGGVEYADLVQKRLKVADSMSTDFLHGRQLEPSVGKL